MTGPVAPPPPARAPLGSTATVRSRLLRQHGRPWLVSAWAALFGELGLAGPPARRRAGRFLLRSLPAAVVALLGALLALPDLRRAAGRRDLDRDPLNRWQKMKVRFSPLAPD